MTSSPGDLDGLALISAGFPAYRFWRSIAVGHSRSVAQATDIDAHPHTVVTDNLTEMAAALAAGQHAPPQ